MLTCSVIGFLRKIENLFTTSPNNSKEESVSGWFQLYRLRSNEPGEHSAQHSDDLLTRWRYLHQCVRRLTQNCRLFQAQTRNPQVP